MHLWLRNTIGFVEVALVTLLAGMLWSTSLVIAPALFDVASSGAVAGEFATGIFDRVIRLAMVLAAALLVIGLVMRPVWKARCVIAAVVTILLLLLLQNGVVNWMADARAAGESREVIMQLHAVAAALYFGASVSALLLLPKRRREEVAA
ncbi:MAG: DUF4149 domain-containing protein [Gammaproteobacteria bacterium]|nr:DUF4149 domain-containing protein [Gammaproteobacteria bacterium]